MFDSIPIQKTDIPGGGDKSARKSTRELKVWQNAKQKQDTQKNEV